MAGVNVDGESLLTMGIADGGACVPHFSSYVWLSSDIKGAEYAPIRETVAPDVSNRAYTSECWMSITGLLRVLRVARLNGRYVAGRS